MARIVENKGKKEIVNTLCEHMGGVELPASAELKDVLFQSSLRAMASMLDYCPVCGQMLHKKERITCRVCSDCGKSVMNSLGEFVPIYCTSCGAKLDGSD